MLPSVGIETGQNMRRTAKEDPEEPVQALASDNGGFPIVAQEVATSPPQHTSDGLNDEGAHSVDAKSSKNASNNELKEPQRQLKLSKANIRALDSMQQRPSPRTARKREIIPPIDTRSFIKNTWESASTAPTSVLSNSTKIKLSRLLLPSSSIDKLHDLLKTYCSDGNSKAVRVLLQQGSNPGTKQSPRPGPICLAVQGRSARHIKCVRLLIEYGVDVNVKKRNGKTPLHLAIENASFKGYSKLL
ncbi:hypothetical protein M426DRAFT_135946 [Hypoxylon sp. CI-4A]|nr:hypothetical protein M426DRAFT_135946 [Hypoxylon sp. CI-4A]